MREDFLHFVWRMQRFNPKQLQTTTGETIEIINYGTLNDNAGPDFLHARIRIGTTLWAGHVEMHLKSSLWMAHKHQYDKAYENVILHVVLDEDQIIYHADGSRIPCLNLRPLIAVGLAKRYLKFLHNETWIPCQHQLYTVSTVARSLWLDRMLIERMEKRTAVLAVRFQNNNKDWEETFYQSLAWGFGLSVNADSFLALAQSLPLKTLLKHKDKLYQLEALLFGQAAMLYEVEDDYPLQLQKEYSFLQKKYALQPLSPNMWRYMRMRPASFPSIRIAQFATLIHRTGQLFNKMMVAKNLKEIENAFSVQLSNYWQTHHRFDKESKKSSKTLGKSKIHLLVINIIAPFLFFYGQQKDEQFYKDKALQLLEELPAESNNIIRHWKQLGFEAKQAAQTQALLELKKNYCDRKRCLSCAIGCQILQQEPKQAMEEEVLYLPDWWMKEDEQEVTDL